MTAVATLDSWAAKRMGLSAPLSRAAIDAWQIARVAETVAEARTASPFYRGRADWPDGVIRTPADIARLPFTWPCDLARNDPTLVALSQSGISRVVTLPTSGTTGKPKRLFFTAEEQQATVDFFQHGMGLFTRAGDRVAIAFPGTAPGGVADGLAEAIRRLGATPIPVPAASPPDEVAALLRRERATVVAGPPVRLLAAARLSLADGGAPLAIRVVLSSSEPLARSVARGLRQAWNCEVFDHWGMTETGFGGGVDCACHAGCHLRETDLFIEVVDPASGAPVLPGAVGEVVVTTMRRRALPLIRYRSGDLARLVVEPCACGSVLHRLAGFAGRLDAAVPLPDGAAVSLQDLDEAVFSADPVVSFTARITTDAPAGLHLTVVTPARLRTAASVDVISNALRAVPTIGLLVERGRLRLDIDLVDPDPAWQAGKRCLLRSAA